MNKEIISSIEKSKRFKEWLIKVGFYSYEEYEKLTSEGDFTKEQVIKFYFQTM